jgi:outer membrane protein TolC
MSSILKKRMGHLYFPILLLSVAMIQTGCRTTAGYRISADKAAESIIKDKQEQLLGEAEDFTIERPSDILRRRLLIEQDLPRSGDGSLGSDNLEPIAHWPEKDYPKAGETSGDDIVLVSGQTLKLSLIQALQVSAMNSPEYQSKKEEVFKSALSLDLARNEFGLTFRGEGETSITENKSGSGDTVKGVEHSGSLGLSKSLKSGAKFAATLAVDLVSLLTQGQTSSFGITGDASVSIPLLRGAGRYIVSEPLTQAERNVVYAIYEFEKYKQTFAVEIARSYLNVLRQLDQVDNNAEVYKNLMVSARRTRALADAGRSTEIQVDQAVQNELSARNRWINATDSYNSSLDSFKKSLGLPPDANIKLDRAELEGLTARISAIVRDIEKSTTSGSSTELVGIGMENAGPLEMEEKAAIELAFDNRLDLRVSEGRVYDAQRSVVVRADALGAEVTLLGQANLGQSRSLGQAGMEDAGIRSDEGVYKALLNIDLPLERTSERKAYRESLISLESAVRDLQSMEDDIKLSIRNRLRSMSKAREALSIQTRAVELAEKRVKSTDMFFEAGRAQLRDILEAQEALLSARNSLTSAVVDYRMAELEFQIDTGILEIDQKGLIVEYYDGEKDDVRL